MTEPTSNSSRLLRPLYFAAGLVLVGLGIVGLGIVGMPTTIFLILAAACFARSSPRLEAWLVNHPKFGPGIMAWRQHGAIPRKAKIIAIVSMAVSFAIVLVVRLSALWTWIIGVLLLASALFVGTRPEGPKASKDPV